MPSRFKDDHDHDNAPPVVLATVFEDVPDRVIPPMELMELLMGYHGWN
jgi:hypothetical protein